MIDIKKLTRGINARRASISITTPSSMPISLAPPIPPAPPIGGAFQEDAFAGDAFQV